MFSHDLSLRNPAVPAHAMPPHEAEASAQSARQCAASHHDWLQSLQDACRAIPIGQLHRHLTARWVERQLSTHPDDQWGRPLSDAGRKALQASCDAARMSLQLHAAFRVPAQAAAISAALMLDLQQCLRLGLEAPLMKCIADRIHAEFQRPGPDWTQIALTGITSEHRLALALTRSLGASEKPPVRFTVDLLRQPSPGDNGGRVGPSEARSRAQEQA